MSTLTFIKRKLTAAEADNLIAGVVGKISGVIHPVAILLFGSAARKELTDQSDIDLLIVMPDASSLNPARKQVARIRGQFGVPVDLVWMSADEFHRRAAIGGVAQVASEEGVLVYGRIPGGKIAKGVTE